MKYILKFLGLILIFTLLLLTVFYFITDRIIHPELKTEKEFKLGLWIEIPLSIKDKSTYALFDTGAQISVLNESSSSKYNVIILPFSFIKVNNQSYHKLGIIPDLTINNIQFKNVLVLIIDFKKEDTSLSCIASDMILGMNIIRKMQWKFNFQARVFTNALNDEKFNNNYTNFLSYNGVYTPKTKIIIGKKEHSVLIDFGYTSTIKLLNTDIDTEDKKESNYINKSDEDIFGKFDEEGIIAKDDLIINKDTFINSVIDFSSSNLEIIGNELFRNYKLVTIDPFERKIFLSERLLSRNDSCFNDFGMSISKSNNAILISYINKNAPIFKRGLLVGDTVSKINGIDSKTISSNYDYCSFLTWRNKVFSKDSITITTMKNNKPFDYLIIRSKYK